MFERFTDQARRVVVSAQEEARMHNHDHIGTEHLLLGLIHEGEGAAVRALESLEISLAAVRYQVEEMIGQGQQAPSGPIPFAPRAKRALELSLRESGRLRDGHIGTGHILLGLISEGEGVAAEVLVKLGADLDRVCTRVVYPDQEPTSTGAEQRERRSGTNYLAYRIKAVEAELSGLEARIDTIESRLSAAEFRVGTGPDMRGLDKEIAQTRRDKEAASGEQDFEAAASLHDKERQLTREKDSRRREWAAAHPDPSSLADKIGQLSDEIEQLRGLLRQQGTEPEEGTA
jgi:ATP-dependent Clp protease ATP-binding subunit ClpA